jgi:type IV secretion system protein VirB1
MADYIAFDNECLRHAQTPIAQAITSVESAFNPYAIGVIGGALVRQPRNKAEAVATVIALKSAGWNYDLGCRQINKANLSKYALDLDTVFDPSKNAAVGSAIYDDCRKRAIGHFGDGDAATRAALSCYNSGNFSTGQRSIGGKPSYADKVLAALPASATPRPGLAIPVVAKAVRPNASPLRKVAVTTNQGDFRGGENPAATQQETRAKKPAWDVFNEF